MTLRRYLLTMSLTTLICWVAFVIVIFQIDPYTSGPVGLSLFFVSLFFAVWGTLSLCGFLFRYVFFRNVVPYKYIGTSLRQAFWFAVILALSLFLASQELFSWWVGGLLVFGLAVFEAFFLARSVEARYSQKQYKR